MTEISGLMKTLYVSLDTAESLKKLGFPQFKEGSKYQYFYLPGYSSELYCSDCDLKYENSVTFPSEMGEAFNSEFYAAPSSSEAVEWLTVNFGMYPEVIPTLTPSPQSPTYNRHSTKDMLNDFLEILNKGITRKDGKVYLLGRCTHKNDWEVLDEGIDKITKQLLFGIQ